MLDSMDNNAGTTATPTTDLDRLVSDLTAAAASYYESDTLLMSDTDYDTGIEQVRAAVSVDPSLATPESDALLTQVAAGVSAGGDIAHPTRMLSMSKAENLDAVDALVARVQDIGRDGVVVEPKMDGLALRVEYVEGRLVLAATRGDGFTGEDVTAQVTRGSGVAGLPLTLSATWSGEVRGEVYMTTPQFEWAQRLRAERGGKPFVNPRNATAGALRKSGAEHWMPLSFAAYDLTDDDALPAHSARMGMANSLGIATAIGLIAKYGVTCGPYDYPEVVRLAIDEIEKARPGLPFEIDGAVIKADHDRGRTSLGEGSRTPNWAIAYKYAAEEATSVIEAIEVSIGRTGRMGLRARITPTFVGGTTVSYATCHNPTWLVAEGIGVGSTVLLKRAGDVIPRITAPLDTAANADIPTWTPPETCPQCGEEWDKSSLLWRCHTPECSVAGRITYFAARDCMDVEGLGGTVAEALAEARLVENVADLYDLSVETLADLPLGETSTGSIRRLGTANATRILGSLETQKAQPLNRVITALGIRMTGRSVGRWLAAAYPTMEGLRAATVADLAAIERLGEIKATHIVNGLATLGPVIDRLADAGVNMGSEPDPAAQGDLPLAGKTYVVSGSVPGYTRTTIAERIELLGGKASSSVSKTTTALVTSETDTSKAKKAADLGIPVIDPDEFVKMLEG